MLREFIYTVGAAFSIITCFYFLVPVWGMFVQSFTPVASQSVTDPAFSTTLATLPNNLTTIFQYSFVALLIGLGIYAGLVIFRKEPTSFQVT